MAKAIGNESIREVLHITADCEGQFLTVAAEDEGNLGRLK
jgi:hypothetical protein